VTEDSFGGRLRRERERRQIALSSISANTKINAALFEALEREDLSRWPTGIFRRAFIRAYATAIGLDPDVVQREFLERFPDPADVLPIAAPESAPAATVGASGETVLRLTLGDAGAPFSNGRLLADMRRRLAAVACDGGVVTAIAITVFVASGKFWVPLAVAMLGYYLGGILLLGNTPGVCLWAPGSGRPFTGSAVAVFRARTTRRVAALLVRFNRSAADKTGEWKEQVRQVGHVRQVGEFGGKDY
jgi:hypothetical protein